MTVKSALCARRPALTLAFCLALFCSLTAVPVSANAATKIEKTGTEAQLKTLRNRMELLKREQSQNREQESGVRAELAQVETAMGLAVRALKETRKQLVVARKRMNNLEAERDTLTAQRDKARNLLAQQVRMAFMVGRDEYWKLLLSQQDPGKIGRVMTYYDYLNKARVVQMQALSESVRSLATVEKTLQDEVSKLNTLKQAQAAETRRLSELKRQREKTLKDVVADIVDADKKMRSLQKDEDALTELLNKVEEVAREVQLPPVKLPKGIGFGQLKGKLGWPVRAKIAQAFGDERHGGRMRWNGVLLAAKEGSDVRAIYHGRVVFSDWLRGFGLMTIIDHGDGYMSLYGHNQSLNKQLGDWIEAGEVLAQSGSTGGQAESGLYFELRYQGKAVDPKAWCRRGE